MSKLAVRSEFGQGYSPTAPTEWHWLSGPVRAQRGERPPLLYCHGSGGSATVAMNTPAEKALLDALAQRYAVIAADLGLQAWGNDRHVQAIEEAIAYLEDRWGATGPVILVAGSMGNLGAMGYLKAHPDNVRAYAGIVPALDLASLNTMPPIPTELAVAYGAPYDDATMGPDHSPVRYAAGLAPGVPMRLWTASNDTITLPSTADAFVAARPATIRTDVGPLGHSAAAVTAAVPSLVEWLRTV